MSPADLLERLQAWRAQGRLRALDLALVRFLHQLDPQADAALLLGVALLSRLEGQGHACLPLQLTPQDLCALMDDAPDHLEALSAALQATGGTKRLPAHAARSPLVQVEPPDESGATPLVLSAGRLYLRRYWACERRIAKALRQRLAAAHPAADLDLFAPFDVPKARSLLARLFPATDGPPPDGMDRQKLACALALRAPVTVVTGGPGTGKTFTAARMLALMQATHAGPAPLRVALAAPTGKAAARLRQSIEVAWQALQPELAALGVHGDALQPPGPALTLHALLGARPGTRRFRHDADRPLDLDVLFVDEASMVHLEMMAALLDALQPATRLVLLGDKDQLASVEAGSVMAELCGGAGAPDGPALPVVEWVRQVSGEVLASAPSPGPARLADQIVVLNESRRFAGAIGALARSVHAGDAPAVLQALREPGGNGLALKTGDPGEAVVAPAVRGRGADVAGFLEFVQMLGTRPADPLAFGHWALSLIQRFDACRVLCAVHDGPWGVAELNTAIERALMPHGLPARRGEWYEGRPVMVTRNDPSLGVFNGDIGVVLRAPGPQGGLRAWFADGPQLRSVAVGRLADVETAFAMTVHKSQGSEFGHVVLVLPERDNPVLTREWLYTGITRARQALTLAGRDDTLLAEATRRRTQRFSGLADMLAAHAT